MASSIKFDGRTEKQIATFASRVLRRLRAGGNQTIALEDIKQELVIAWCKARDAYSPDHGVPFAAYLARGMMLHINRWADAEMQEYWSSGFTEDDDGRRLYDGKLSMDAEQNEGGEDEVTLHGAVSSELANPEELAIESDIRRRVFAIASSAAKSFLSLLDSPPAYIIEEVEAMRAKAAYSRERGMAGWAPTGVTAHMIMDFLGFSQTERRSVYEEVRMLTAEVSQK